jgi:riboflavin kinase/FMN adenylyltransferase
MAGSIRRVATIGAFDGLHLGHREIARRTLAIARDSNDVATIFSFEPTPAEHFSPIDPPARLTCLRERVELLADMDFDEMFCPRFAEVCDWSAERFVTELLAQRLNVSHLVVGHDFQFGKGRKGTLDFLRQAGIKQGFEVTTVAPIDINGERISSTGIRAALSNGELARAKEMLGRDYSMSGRVVHGRGLGRELGFPTANVNLKRRIAPVDGIFAVRVSGIGGRLLDGVASVGNRPTIGGGKTLLEVFLFDFDQDIYGQYLSVHFVARLREERMYPDLTSMQQQMRIDVLHAQAALAHRIA